MKNPQLNLFKIDGEDESDMLRFEKAARKKGYKIVAGVDEAGRGPLAGPVVAAACILPAFCPISGINDSKKLTVSQREALFEQLVGNDQVFYGIGIIDHAMIDKVNILQATLLAMVEAVRNLPVTPDFILVDGVSLPSTCIPGRCVIKGDSLSFSIAAASILAKVTRDRMMIDYHARWPEYGFDTHKGYGTAKHLQAIQQSGPCPIHRLSFAPLSIVQKLSYTSNGSL